MPQFELIAVGKGFVGILDDKSSKKDHEKYAEEAMKICKEKILSEKYDLVILDEINYAVNLGLISSDSVIELIKIRPEKLIGFSTEGENSTFEKSAKTITDNTCIVVGGFQKGHFSENIKNKFDQIEKLSENSLETHVILSRIIYEYEKTIFM